MKEIQTSFEIFSFCAKLLTLEILFHYVSNTTYMAQGHAEFFVQLIVDTKNKTMYIILSQTKLHIFISVCCHLLYVSKA